MSIAISIPTMLRRFVDGADELFVEANDVNSALLEAVRLHPKLESQLFGNNGKVRNFILVFVNSSNVKQLQNEKTPLSLGDKISLIPAIAGG